MDHPEKLAPADRAVWVDSLHTWGTTDVGPMLLELKRQQALERGNTAVGLYWLHRREKAIHREALAIAETGAPPPLVLHGWAEAAVRSLRERRPLQIIALIKEGNELIKLQARAERWLGPALLDQVPSVVARWESFRARQRVRRDWICMAWLAEWWVRIDNSTRPNEKKRHDAYRELGKALEQGEFDMRGRGRPCVAYAVPGCRGLRMTLEVFDALPKDGGYPALALEHCWIPRELARHFLINRDHKMPPWVTDERNRAPGNAKLPAIRSQSVKPDTEDSSLANGVAGAQAVPRREASEVEIHAAIAAEYARAKRDHQKAPNLVEICQPVVDRLAAEGRRTSKKRVQDLAKDPRYDGQRQPTGTRFRGFESSET